MADPAARDRAVRGVAIELAGRGGGGRRLIHVDVRRRRHDDVTEQARLHQDPALGRARVRELAERGEHGAVREDAGAPARAVRHPARAAGRPRQPVLVGEQVVDVRLAGRKQREVAGRLVEDDLVDERGGLGVERGEQLGAARDRPVAEPHRVEAVNLIAGARIGEQARRLGAPRGGIGEAHPSSPGRGAGRRARSPPGGTRGAWRSRSCSDGERRARCSASRSRCGTGTPDPAACSAASGRRRCRSRAERPGCSRSRTTAGRDTR